MTRTFNKAVKTKTGYYTVVFNGLVYPDYVSGPYEFTTHQLIEMTPQIQSMIDTYEKRMRH